MPSPALGKVRYKGLTPDKIRPLHMGMPLSSLLQASMSEEFYMQTLAQRMRDLMQGGLEARQPLQRMGAPASQSSQPAQIAGGARPPQYQPSGIADTIALKQQEDAISRYLLEEMRRISAANQPSGLEQAAPLIGLLGGALTGGLLSTWALPWMNFGATMGSGVGGYMGGRSGY